MQRAPRIVLATAVLAILVARPADATFHVMQIEQVIGGVDGNTGIQAIQLRTRAPAQNFVSEGLLYVRDATGSNPVLLLAPPGDVLNGATGARVLLATSSFSGATSPSLTPDFVLTNPIPDTYMAAGTLTWEDVLGTVYWRLSWGGAAYTGPGSGSTLNDANGDFNPPFPGPLPTATTQALLFQFAATAQSTTNANDYALTPAAATFRNNSSATGTIVAQTSVEPGPLAAQLALSTVSPNPVGESMAYSITLPTDSHVRVRLLDVGGRVVRAVADERLSAGHHNLAWDASRGGPPLANGVYFLDLDAAGAHRVQRFVLLH